MKRFNKFLDNLEKYLLVIGLIIMLFVTVGNVASRKILHFSIAFSEELTINLFVIVSLLGAAVSAKKGSLIGLNIIFSLMPPKIQKFFHFVGLVASVLFIGVLIFYGIKTVQTQILSGQTTPALKWPKWIFGAFVPIGAIFAGIRLIYFYISNMLGKGEK